MSKLHSERHDNTAGKLEKRFGHPALHSELFTPLLHAKMMPLLSQVYQGRLGHERRSLAEYAGQKMEAQIAPGGLRIAGIEEADLAYDLAQYQRERGQQDWDNRSMSSSNMLGDGVSVSTHAHKPQGYDAYMAHGLSRAPHEEFEMANIESQIAADVTPLLPPHQGFAGQQQHYHHGQYSQDDLTAPPLTRHHTDNTSTYSGYSRSQEVQHADPYGQSYQYPPQYVRPPSAQRLASNSGYDDRSYSRQPSEQGYNSRPYNQSSSQNQNTRRPGGW